MAATDSNRMNTFLQAVSREGMYSSGDNLLFYTRQIFDGVPIEGKRFLDIGGGTGIYTFYAALMGAPQAVCLEPEALGSTAGVTAKFERMHGLLGLSTDVRIRGATIQEFDPGETRFEVVLLNNSLNHVDEEACVVLDRDPEARDRYVELFGKLHALCAPGAKLVATDCSNRNFFADLGLKNPIMPSIEWEKHQPPEVWAALLAKAGFRNPRIRWTSLNPLRDFGRALLANRVAAYFLQSHFCLTMDA